MGGSRISTTLEALQDALWLSVKAYFWPLSAQLVIAVRAFCGGLEEFPLWLRFDAATAGGF